MFYLILFSFFLFLFLFFINFNLMKSNKGTYPLGPLEIKTKAMEEGMQFAWDVGVREVFFECNSMIVAEVLLGHGDDPPMAIRNIIEGIRHKLQDFQQFQIAYIKRQGNRLAHLLARHAKSVDSYVTWIEKNHFFIESALSHDVMFLSSS